jgi:hypothetical protein
LPFNVSRGSTSSECLQVNQTNSTHQWLYSPLLDLGRLSTSLILYTVGRTPWTGDQLIAIPLSTQDNTNLE